MASSWHMRVHAPREGSFAADQQMAAHGLVRRRQHLHQGQIRTHDGSHHLYCRQDRVGALRRSDEKWAQSVDLKIDPIIAPGNEDEKSMENMLFLLDELKRVDPLRRAEPGFGHRWRRPHGHGWFCLCIVATGRALGAFTDDVAGHGRRFCRHQGRRELSSEERRRAFLFSDSYLRRCGVLAYFGASRLSFPRVAK